MYHNVLFTKLVSLVDYQILRCIGQTIRSLVFDPTMPSVTITVKMRTELFLRRTSSLCTSHCASLLLTHLSKNFLGYYRLGYHALPTKATGAFKNFEICPPPIYLSRMKGKNRCCWLTLEKTTVCNKSCVYDSCKIHPIRLKKGSPGLGPG